MKWRLYLKFQRIHGRERTADICEQRVKKSVSVACLAESSKVGRVRVPNRLTRYGLNTPRNAIDIKGRRGTLGRGFS